MHKIKEKLMEILDEYEDRARNNPDGRLSDMEIQKIHMLTDTVKNICKIEMLEYGEGYSERVDGDSRRGYSREGYSRDGEWMARGGYGGNSYREDGGSSYDEGGSSYARRRRDSMGRYSRADGKEHMAEKLREMMQEAEGEEREAIRKCLKEIEKA
jgi:hypothetical protein